ncbi:MAG: hypothetical protein KF878_08325 [Planctomycetes bacterium]|nr:hypothetical protein [Planctomycetota bacterium]
MARATKRLHITLSQDLHAHLHGVAVQEGRPATEIAREVIERWLDAHRRTARRAAIAEYATAMADSGVDFDPDLERAAVGHLLGTRARKKRPRSGSEQQGRRPNGTPATPREGGRTAGERPRSRDLET